MEFSKALHESVLGKEISDLNKSFNGLREDFSKLASDVRLIKWGQAIVIAGVFLPWLRHLVG